MSSASGLTASWVAGHVASSPSSLTSSSAAGLGQGWGQQASGVEAEFFDEQAPMGEPCADKQTRNDYRRPWEDLLSMEQQALADVGGEGEVVESKRALQCVVIAAVKIQRTETRELVCPFP